MITVLIQPLPCPEKTDMRRACQSLYANMQARLDAGQRAYLEAAWTDRQDCSRRAKSLLARALVLKHLPRQNLRMTPGSGLMAGDMHISFSYSANCVICGLGRRPLGLDAEEILAGPKAGAIARFYQRIRLDWPQHMGRSALTRAWTVCEAILKLAGTGWSAQSAALLAQLPIERRRESGKISGMPISWRALPFHGHWLGVAVSGKMSKVFCKLLPAFAI